MLALVKAYFNKAHDLIIVKGGGNLIRVYTTNLLPAGTAESRYF
jgi:uridylate kinase